MNQVIRGIDSQQMIRKLLEENGFKIVVMRNFFIFTLPFIYIRSLLNKKVQNIDPKDAERKSGFKINFTLNYFFRILTYIEDKLFYFFSPKIGSSIIILAVKEEKKF